MAAIPDPTTTGPLSGEALIAFIIKTVAALRVFGSIRTKDQIPKNSAGAAALRYLGSQLMAFVPKVRAFLLTTFPTGALSGLGYTLEDYDRAVARAADAHETDTAVSELGKDAHAEAVAAQQDLADMILKALKAYLGTTSLVSADAKVKAVFKSAGAKLDVTLAQLKEGRKASRLATADLKAKAGTISTQEEELQQLQTDAAVKKLQDQLKLQNLTGDPVRPKDLVVTGQDVEPATPSTTRYGRAQDTQQKSSPSPTAGKARRKSPR